MMLICFLLRRPDWLNSFYNCETEWLSKNLLWLGQGTPIVTRTIGASQSGTLDGGPMTWTPPGVLGFAHDSRPRRTHVDFCMRATEEPRSMDTESRRDFSPASRCSEKIVLVTSSRNVPTYRRWPRKRSEKVENGKGDSRRTVSGPIPKAEHGDRTGSAKSNNRFHRLENRFILIGGSRRTIIHRECRTNPRTGKNATMRSVLRTIEICNQTAENSANPENSNRRSRLRGEPSHLEQSLEAKSVVKRWIRFRLSTIEDVLCKRRSTIENRLIPESTAICRCDKVVVDCSETRRLCDSDKETERSERPPTIGAMS